MNKKIVLMGLLAVFMLVSISFVTSAEVNKEVDKKESPLYGIRTKSAIGAKISNILENIKSRFIGNRVFFMPSLRIRITNVYNPLKFKGTCDAHGACLPTS